MELKFGLRNSLVLTLCQLSTICFSRGRERKGELNPQLIPKLLSNSFSLFLIHVLYRSHYNVAERAEGEFQFSSSFYCSRSVGRGGDLSCPLKPLEEVLMTADMMTGQASNSKEKVRKFLGWWNQQEERLNPNRGGFYYSFRKVSDVKQGLLSPYLLRKSLNFERMK